MDRITRKSLKTDRFAAEVTESVEYLAEHRRQAMLYGGIAAALLVIAAGVFFYWRHRNEAAHEGIAKALVNYRATISEDEVPGRVSFRTEEEKNKQCLKDFEAIARSYPRHIEGKVAHYYLGLVYHDMGNNAEAQKRLDQAIAEGPENISSLARLALADIYGSQGKDAEARKLYEYLIQHPTDMVPEARAQLAMARYLRARNPQEARKLLLALLQRPGPVSGAAGNMLRELGQ